MARRATYRDIAEHIRERWIASCTQVGAKLPTERELHSLLGASRVTISRALALLTEQGLIERRRGSGSYVRVVGEGVKLKPTIAFIAPFIADLRAVGGPLPTLVYCGIEERAHQLGYQVLSASSNYTLDQETALIEHFKQAGCTGLILMPVTEYPLRDPATAAQDPLARRWRDLPIVLADLGCPEWNRPVVSVNNYRLGFEMAQALIDHGHQNILFMDTDHRNMMFSIHQRRAGYLRAMELNGLSVPDAYRLWPNQLVKADRFAFQYTDLIADQLLQLDPRPDAVMAWEDAMAMQLMDALLTRGIRIPDQIRVTGFDNHLLGQHYRIPFPTTDPDFQQMGQTAVDLVDQMAQGIGRSPESVQMNGRVIWRSPELVRNREGDQDE